MNNKFTKKALSVALSVTTAVWLLGVSVMPVAAATLQEQIDILLAQITALQAQLSTAQGGTATTSYNYTQDLTLGSKGDDVVALQTLLVSKGYLVMPTGVAMGYFGPLTQAGVTKLQVAEGITPTAGYFGPITRAKVAQLAVTTPTTTLPAGCTSTVGFSPTTGVSCATGTTTTTTATIGTTAVVTLSGKAIAGSYPTVALKDASNTSLCTPSYYVGAADIGSADADTLANVATKLATNIGTTCANYVTASAVAGAITIIAKTGVAAFKAEATDAGLGNDLKLATVYSVATTPTTPVAAGLTVGLASDAPASRSVVLLEAGADLAHFTFTGSGTVTNVSLKRLGISADASLLNVYLYDGATRLTDAASVSNNSLVIFNDSNGLFTVNGSKTISVRADMNAAAGETVGIQLISATAGAVAVTGGSLSGNLMSAASATLAGVSFGSVTPAANTSLTPAADIVVWQSTATVTTRDVSLSRFTIREVGGIAKADLKNLRLIIDGVTIATVANPDINGYSTFVPASPLKLITGSHIFKVMADVVGGSSLSFTFSIRNKTDIGLVDTQYGVGLLTSTAVGSLTGFLQTVATGYITVQKATDSPSSTIVLSGTDVVLARFTATTYGENVKVDTLTVDLTLSTAGSPTLRNGRILIDGAQAGSTSTIDPLADTTATDAGTAFNINRTFLAGTTAIIEVRADVYNNATGGTAIAATDTIKATLYGAANLNNAQGLVSGDATLDVPSATTSGNTLTVGSGSMTLAKDQAYGNQTVVVPTTVTLLGSWTLTSGTNEALNLDTIQVDFTTAGDFAPADLTSVYIMYGAKTTSTKATITATSGTTSVGNSWSISEAMAANSTLAFKVYGNIATGAVVSAGGDTVVPSLKVSGTSTSGTAVSTNGDAVLAGQTISAVGSGTLTVSLDTNTPVATQVVAGTTDTAGALKVKLAGTNEDQYVKSVRIYVDTSSNTAAIASLNLASATTSNGTYATVGADQTVINDGTNPGYATWNLSGAGRITVAKNASVYLKVTPTYVSSGQTAVTGKTPKLFLGDLQAEGTSVLAASSGTPNLVNDTGIIVQAGSSSTYADSTETLSIAIAATTTTALVVTGTIAFVPGDVFFIDTYNAAGAATPDSKFNSAYEELMVVLSNDGGGNLVVKRGAFGTTARAVYETTDKLYSLGGLVANINGIVGNAQTVLNTKLGLAVKSDSPSGAFTGGTGKYLFGVTASAANNSADPATNTVTITSIDITNNKAVASVANLKAYPAEYDNNATFATTCVGLSATKWRCALVTTGSTNQVDENASRSYTFRGDLGYSAAGSVDFSVASLGTSDDSANSVVWTDGTTSQTWVNQAVTVLQGGSLTTTGASGTRDQTAPTISSITITDATADNALTVGATILITFSEMMDPTTIGSFVPGAVAVAVTNGAVGDISGIDAGGASSYDTIKIMGIASITTGATTFITADATCANTAALNSSGTELTLVVTTALTGVGADGTEAFEAGSAITTVTDVNGNAFTAAGSNAATVTSLDL